MKIGDLGTLKGPVVFFGGPYSNLQATQALLAEAEAQGVPPGNLICTGDIAAYCAQPVETITLLRENSVATVKGNTDENLATQSDDCGCGYESGSACDLLSALWYGYANKALGPAERNWLGGLPDLITFQHRQKRYAVIHGGITSLSRFLWPNSEHSDFREEIDAVALLVGSVDVIVAGHCGVAFEKQIDETLWVNAGTIGMPRNDGRPETEYVVVHEQPKLKRLRYDNRLASDCMVRAGLNQGYHNALMTGWWPNEDILPPELRFQGAESG